MDFKIFLEIHESDRPSLGVALSFAPRVPVRPSVGPVPPIFSK